MTGWRCALSQAGSCLALAHDGHPGAHDRVEVAHGDAVGVGGDPVEESVGFRHLLRASVFEVAAISASILDSVNPDIVLGFVKATVDGTSGLEGVVHILGHLLKEGWVGRELSVLLIADCLLRFVGVVLPVVEATGGEHTDLVHDVLGESWSCVCHSAV